MERKSYEKNVQVWMKRKTQSFAYPALQKTQEAVIQVKMEVPLRYVVVLKKELCTFRTFERKTETGRE